MSLASRRRRRTGGHRIPLAALALLLAFPAPATPQTGGILDRVDALVLAGRAEEGRAALLEWWEGAGARRGGPPRAELQHALWLRGLLTVDPVQASLDYQRLVVEFPGGPWSDQALLRLAHVAEANEDMGRAREHLEALLRDYPGSPHRLEAGRLLERLRVEGARGRVAATPRAAAPAAAPAPSVAAPAPSAPAGHGSPAAAPAPAPAGRWTVQVGAFASPERARSLRDQLVAGGIDARLALVSGNPLLRVRAGRFTDPELADALRRGLLARGYDATVSSDADREDAVP